MYTFLHPNIYVLSGIINLMCHTVHMKRLWFYAYPSPSKYLCALWHYLFMYHTVYIKRLWFYAYLPPSKYLHAIWHYLFYVPHGIHKTAMILCIPFSIQISTCSLALFILCPTVYVKRLWFYVYLSPSKYPNALWHYLFLFNLFTIKSHMYDTANPFLHLGTIQKLILGSP